VCHETNDHPATPPVQVHAVVDNTTHARPAALEKNSDIAPPSPHRQTDMTCRRRPTLNTCIEESGLARAPRTASPLAHLKDTHTLSQDTARQTHKHAHMDGWMAGGVISQSCRHSPTASAPVCFEIASTEKHSNTYTYRRIPPPTPCTWSHNTHTHTEVRRKQLLSPRREVLLALKKLPLCISPPLPSHMPCTIYAICVHVCAVDVMCVSVCVAACLPFRSSQPFGEGLLGWITACSCTARRTAS